MNKSRNIFLNEQQADDSICRVGTQGSDTFLIYMTVVTLEFDEDIFCHGNGF